MSEGVADAKIFAKERGCPQQVPRSCMRLPSKSGAVQPSMSYDMQIL